MIRKMLFAIAAFTFAQSAAFAADTVVEVDRDRLSEPAYVEALYAELETAAKKVCKAELAGSPFYLNTLRSCIDSTVAETVKKIDSPMLTAYGDDGALPEQVASVQ